MGVCACVGVGVSAPKATNNYWDDMDPSDWLNKYYSFCMAPIVGIVSSCGLRNEARRRNQPIKSKLALYKPLLHFYSQLYMSNKT